MISIARLDGFEALGYSALTFPVLQSLLAPVAPGTDGRILVGARCGSEPVGLAVALPRKDGALELLSVNVVPTLRRRGVGRALLERVAEEARGAGRERAVCRLETGRRRTEALEGLLRRAGWIETHPLGLLCRIDDRYGALKGAPWIAAVAPRDGEEFLPWSREAFRALSEGDAIPAALDPGGDDGILEASESLVLKSEGAWAGWLVAHRPGARVLRYTSLYVRPGAAASGAGARLVAEAIRRHVAVPGERASFLASSDFPRMVAFARRRIAPWCAEANELVEFARTLAP